MVKLAASPFPLDGTSAATSGGASERGDESGGAEADADAQPADDSGGTGGRAGGGAGGGDDGCRRAGADSEDAGAGGVATPSQRDVWQLRHEKERTFEERLAAEFKNYNRYSGVPPA
jgi:hypothetical protein